MQLSFFTAAQADAIFVEAMAAEDARARGDDDGLQKSLTKLRKLLGLPSSASVTEIGAKLNDIGTKIPVVGTATVRTPRAPALPRFQTLTPGAPGAPAGGGGIPPLAIAAGVAVVAVLILRSRKG